jgi:hypothetical protein
MAPKSAWTARGDCGRPRSRGGLVNQGGFAWRNQEGTPGRPEAQSSDTLSIGGVLRSDFRGSAEVLCHMYGVVEGRRLDIPAYVRPDPSVRHLAGVPVVFRRLLPSRLTILVASVRERVGGLVVWALIYGHSASGPHVAVTSPRTSGRENHRN